MENPRGRIIAVERSVAAPYALVEVEAIVHCARCREGRGCGAGLLGSSAGNRRVTALIGEGLAVDEGDEVRIELAPSNLLQASLVVYGAPLVGAVVAAALAYLSGLGDLPASLAALAGIIGGLLVARRRLQKSGCLRRFTPTVVERLAVSQRDSRA
jgi:sigma-E factor negative regulatory protein RseC